MTKQGKMVFSQTTSKSTEDNNAITFLFFFSLKNKAKHTDTKKSLY